MPPVRPVPFVGPSDGPRLLWLRRLDSTSARALPGTNGESFPFWSPDSRSVGFFADATLKRRRDGQELYYMSLDGRHGRSDPIGSKYTNG